MKYPSAKDWLFGLAILGTVLLLTAIIVVDLTKNPLNTGKIFFFLFIIATNGALLWVWFGTWYKIDQEELYYQSGPLKGRIPLEQVKRITVNTTLWSGIKPALSRKGLIILYNKYDEIYLSPRQQQQFLTALRNRLPQLEIVDPNEPKI